MSHYLLTDHREKDWFKASLKAHNQGRDHVYLHGIHSLKKDMENFYLQNYQHIKPYRPEYQPNPFRHQYDLFMHLWINFHKILKSEIKELRRLAVVESNDSYNDQADELHDTSTLYGITRVDCMFAAGELRWPTSILHDGSRRGSFIRDPWAERRIKALSHETIKYVAGFGGGGQGKTTVFIAADLLLWDHYIFTEKGARVMLSTTNQDKLDSVGWPYISRLYKSTESGISLYAGRGRLAGKYTIQRPDNKDTGGVVKGVLLGVNTSGGRIIDKLTGAHGHPYVGYTLDEATTTPPEPLDAADNFTMHAGDYRIKLAFNYDTDSDTGGENVKPPGGWETVDEHTGEWITKTKNGKAIIVLHFNNNDSPGMTEEGARLFPHMPSLRVLNEKYPDESKRVMSNLGFRRFWVGFRFAHLLNDLVLSEEFVNSNGANQDLIFKDNKFQSFFSFDSAPAEIDRNFMLVNRHGLCPFTNQRIFGPHLGISLKKTSESLRYYRESSAEILEHAKNHGIVSGGGIVDFTGRPGHAEHLHAASFHVTRIVYNQAVPDGRRSNTVTRRVERAIPLGIQVDFKEDSGPDRVWYAHEVAENLIDFAAWLTRQYIIAKRLRGINLNFLKNVQHHGLDLELFHRKWRKKVSSSYGERFKLYTKDEFRKEFDFSPEIQDNLFQSSYYAFMQLRIPLTPIDSDVTVMKETERDRDIEKLQELHKINNNSSSRFNEMGISIQVGGIKGTDSNYWNRF